MEYTPEFNESSKKAIDDFIRAIGECESENQASSYAIAMIIKGAKLINASKGPQYKKQLLQEAMKDPSAIVFAKFKAGMPGHIMA